MSENFFRRLLAAITAVGIFSTAVLVIYTSLLYSNASIISFIANGR